ncbi:MAG: response regulator, partial [Magnetococcales bacterium]|nr:response regulator [Magnetococcales bacterium]
IIGLSELFLRTELSRKQRDYINKIEISAKALLGIINDILDFSKIEAGKLGLDEVDFDLTYTLNTLDVMFGELARKKQLSFETRIAPDVLRRVRGDPHRLNQVLTNLLGNAIKFTEAGGVELEVDMALRGEGSWLQFHVKDTGLGMHEDQIAYLFQPFTQADSSTTRRFGGTGLGLSITKKLIELMGGTIQVSSQLGQGSDFHFVLPFGQAACPSEILEIQPVRTTYKMVENAKILLVEDDPLNQVVLKGMFRHFGTEIVLATNGQEALDLLVENHFDIVFMDCHMPIMDGLMACRLWREREASRQLHSVPVIALTALAMTSDREACLQAGMTDFLSKPISLQQLEEVLQRWLYV